MRSAKPPEVSLWRCEQARHSSEPLAVAREGEDRGHGSRIEAALVVRKSTIAIVKSVPANLNHRATISRTRCGVN